MLLENEEISLVLTKVVPADTEKNWLKAYHYVISDHHGNAMGICDLRIGYNDNVYFGGNIGYTIEEPYRGHHYAAKACKLLFGQAREEGMDYVIITCNPDNFASRKTCEYAGGTLLETVELPADNDMRERGETHKCIYRFSF